MGSLVFCLMLSSAPSITKMDSSVPSTRTEEVRFLGGRHWWIEESHDFQSEEIFNYGMKEPEEIERTQRSPEEAEHRRKPMWLQHRKYNLSKLVLEPS